MHALYGSEPHILASVRNALSPGDVGVATGSWSDFAAAAPRADCLIVGARWLSADLRARLGEVASGSTGAPLVLVTTRDADNARAALATGAKHIVWLDEVTRELRSVLRDLRGHVVLRRAAALIEGSPHLSFPLRTALARACRAQRPIRSVGEFAAMLQRDRRTLWRHWQGASAVRDRLRLEDFLDWVLVLHAASRKSATRSWGRVAHDLGLHEHTLARIVSRVVRTSLTNLGMLTREEVEARFLRTVVHPLTTPPPATLHVVASPAPRKAMATAGTTRGGPRR